MKIPRSPMGDLILSPLYKALPLVLFSALCSTSALGQTVVATITLHVQTKPSPAQGEQIPKVELIGGKPFLELKKEHNGQTLAIAVGTLMFLHFDATGFDVNPPGVLEPPAGVFHL